MAKANVIALVLLTSVLSVGNAASKELLISADIAVQNVMIEVGNGQVDRYGECRVPNHKDYYSGRVNPGESKILNIPMVGAAACYNLVFLFDQPGAVLDTLGCHFALGIVDGRLVSSYLSDTDSNGRATLRVTGNTKADCQGQLSDSVG